jgi:hypothetical protein
MHRPRRAAPRLRPTRVLSPRSCRMLPPSTPRPTVSRIPSSKISIALRDTIWLTVSLESLRTLSYRNSLLLSSAWDETAPIDGSQALSAPSPWPYVHATCMRPSRPHRMALHGTARDVHRVLCVHPARPICSPRHEPCARLSSFSWFASPPICGGCASQNLGSIQTSGANAGFAVPSRRSCLPGFGGA